MPTRVVALETECLEPEAGVLREAQVVFPGVGLPDPVGLLADGRVVFSEVCRLVRQDLWQGPPLEPVEVFGADAFFTENSLSMDPS